MALHVDVVKNDWLAGIQYPLATLNVDGEGRISVHAEHPERWQSIVDDLNSIEDPASALAGLHTKLNGSHLFATEAHDEGDCRYRGGPAYLRRHDVSRNPPAVPVGG